MLTKNTPERRNRRRKAALERLLKSLPADLAAWSPVERRHYDALQSRIVRSAADVRSRKYGSPVPGRIRPQTSGRSAA